MITGWRVVTGVMFFALLRVGLTPATASAAIAYVQSTYSAPTGTTTGTSVAVTFTNPVTAGNLIAVLISWGTTNPNDLQSVTDSRGNSYTILTFGGNRGIADAPDIQSAGIAYAKNVAGGTTTVTATFSSTPNWRAIAIHEISGADPTAPLDGFTGQLQSSVATTADAVTSGSITTTANGDYVLGATSPNYPVTITAGTGDTGRANDTPNGSVQPIATEDRIQSTAGSIAATFTVNASGGVITFVTAFKPCAAVSNPSYVVANAQNAQVTVYWSSANVVILEKTSPFAGEAPTTGVTYSAGQMIGGATVKYAGSATSWSRPSPTNGTTYYYKLFVNSSTCYSAGVSVNVTPNASVPQWSYDTTATTMAAPGLAPNYVVIAGSNDWNIHGMQATSGGALAFPPLATGNVIQGRPAVIPSDLGSGQFSAYDRLTGLAYWKFDEGSGATTADASGNGHTGTLQGSPVPAWTAGYRGNALSFDGTQNYVSVPHTAALDAFPITVTAWFKTNATGTTSRSIVNKYASSSYNGYNLFLYNGGLCAWYFTGSNTTNYIYNGSGNCSLSPGVTVNDNNWHHVAFVVDTQANGAQLYVDGVLKATQPWTGTAQATTTTQPISIGWYPGSGAVPFFPGVIDEVRIYNRALTAAEVSAVYNGLSIAYVTSTDNSVYALNTNTGSQVWKSPSLTNLYGGPAVWVTAFASSVAICGVKTDVVFVGTRITGSGANKVYALNGGSNAVTTTATGTNCPAVNTVVQPGNPIWTYAGTNMYYISSTPYVDYTAGAVWVTSRANGMTTNPSVWKFSVADGTLLHSWTGIGDIDADPTPSADGSFLYVGNISGGLAPLWAIQTASPYSTYSYTPIGVNAGAGGLKSIPWPVGTGIPDTIIFCRNATVHSVTFTGSAFIPNWNMTPTGAPASVSGPVDDGAGNVYVGDSNGKVHQILISAGVDLKQENAPASATLGDPDFDVVLNRLYIGASDGHIYAFGTSPF